MSVVSHKGCEGAVDGAAFDGIGLRVLARDADIVSDELTSACELNVLAEAAPALPASFSASRMVTASTDLADEIQRMSVAYAGLAVDVRATVSAFAASEDGIVSALSGIDPHRATRASGPLNMDLARRLG